MTKKIKSITIYKPQETATFAIGAKLVTNGKEVDNLVVAIQVNFFNTARISFSDGMVLVFKGFPVVYEI